MWSRAAKDRLLHPQAAAAQDRARNARASRDRQPEPQQCAFARRTGHKAAAGAGTGAAAAAAVAAIVVCIVACSGGQAGHGRSGGRA